MELEYGLTVPRQESSDLKCINFFLSISKRLFLPFETIENPMIEWNGLDSMERKPVYKDTYITELASDGLEGNGRELKQKEIKIYEL